MEREYCCSPCDADNSGKRPEVGWLIAGTCHRPRPTGRSGRISKVSTEINVLALVKGDERYVFLFDDDNRVETLRQIGRYAANPELSFTWYDAAVMSQKIRQTGAEKKKTASQSLDLSDRFRMSPSSESLLDYFDDREAA